ncbi:MAG: hypothetical protein JRI25_21990, partial [Deltaproteobacteria bacterium]|nr:hypothetical protein [Deltaproteobacteria bacterium]
ADAPILLRTSDDSGHGHGMPLEARIAWIADEYVFLLHQLGVASPTP